MIVRSIEQRRSTGDRIEAELFRTSDKRKRSLRHTKQLPGGPFPGRPAFRFACSIDQQT
jgi:hypothetical protein